MRCHPKRVLTYFLVLALTVMFILTILDFNESLHRSYTLQGDAFKYHNFLRHMRGYKQESFHLWPTGFDEIDDRVVAQIKYDPKSAKSNSTRHKLIHVFTGLGQILDGGKQFVKDRCPVKHCILTEERKFGPKADVVLFQNYMTPPPWRKPQNQIWIMFSLESPENSMPFKEYYNMINWTATYRRDSTIVTPYERWTPNVTLTARLKMGPFPDYAGNKSRKVAWFVSNCGTQNGRSKYVEELRKYIQVDIYGVCGDLQCPRHREDECFDMLRKNYKFYLAFENSNCKDYITEKLYWNAYRNDVVPIVMGARPIDYKLSCPPHSYIHVDDFKSPKELASYLLKLDKDDHLYNEYFLWKGTGNFIDTKFWCRLCAMAHETSRNAWYTDVDQWWRGGNTCIHPLPDQQWATWQNRSLSNNFTSPLIYGPYNTSHVLLNVTLSGTPAMASYNYN